MTQFGAVSTCLYKNDFVQGNHILLSYKLGRIVSDGNFLFLYLS